MLKPRDLQSKMTIHGKKDCILSFQMILILSQNVSFRGGKDLWGQTKRRVSENIDLVIPRGFSVFAGYLSEWLYPTPSPFEARAYPPFLSCTSWLLKPGSWVEEVRKNSFSRTIHPLWWFLICSAWTVFLYLFFSNFLLWYNIKCTEKLQEWNKEHVYTLYPNSLTI